MLKALKPGGEPRPVWVHAGPSHCYPTPLPTKATGRREPVHTSTPSHQLKKQCPKTSPSTPTRAQHFQPVFQEARSCPCIDFSQPAAMIPPPRALTVVQLWVSGWLCIPRDPGFPMQRQLPGLPFLERVLLTSGQFQRRHIQRLGNNVHLQTGAGGGH